MILYPKMRSCLRNTVIEWSDAPQPPNTSHE